MPSLRLALVPRHTFQEWGRQALVDIFVANAVLKADLKRLEARCTQVGRCDSCKRGATVTIQDNGWWLCRRCQLTTQEVRA